VHPNADVPLSAWEAFFFSTNSFRGTNITGQPVYGSVNDYYHEVSCDRFTFTGKVFDWVTLANKRADYSQGTANNRTREAFFREALDKLTARVGAGALRDFDGLAVIYAGERFPTANESLPQVQRQVALAPQLPRKCARCRRMANIKCFVRIRPHSRPAGLPSRNPGSKAWHRCAM
jgi:M6 family metalloprotease-like protein